MINSYEFRQELVLLLEKHNAPNECRVRNPCILVEYVIDLLTALSTLANRSND